MLVKVSIQEFDDSNAINVDVYYLPSSKIKSGSLFKSVVNALTDDCDSSAKKSLAIINRFIEVGYKLVTSHAGRAHTSWWRTEYIFDAPEYLDLLP